MKNVLLIFSLLLLIPGYGHSQSLRSLKNRLENEIIDEAVDELFGKDSDSEEKSTNTQTDTGSDKPSQKSGSEGLDSSPADVPQELDQAAEKFSANEYKSARAALRRALQSLEMQIGGQLIAELPKEVKAMAYQSDEDEVATSTSGWTGLSVHREYRDGDRWSAITIYNSSYAGIAQSAIQAGFYAEYSSDEEDQKSIVVKGNDAVIRYSDSEGYAISISLGQQTLIVIEGVNISNEAAMVAIAESYDYEKIRRTLGDQ